MSSVIANVCDAVAAELTAETFGLEFPAVTRHWIVRYELKALDTLRVAVVPSGATWEFANRSGDRTEFGCDVVIAKRGNMADNDTVDPLAALGEEFIAHFQNKSLATDGQNIVCVRRAFGSPEESAVDLALLQDLRLVLIVVRLTWLLR